MSDEQSRRARPGRAGRGPAGDGGQNDQRQPQQPPDESAEQSRVEQMGIPPLWAVSGSGGAKTRELKKQLTAAEEALEAARAQERQAREQYLRLAAEMDNMRKRHQQERQDQLFYGNAELITRILPLLDNFHRALEHAPEGATDDPAVKSWVDGLLLVVKQFEDILAAMGVEPIVSVGEQFDPALHQAVMAEPSDDHEEGQVIAELQRGYRLRDRVLRPSMVKVASGG